jgi:hypothetical protein
VQYCTGKGIVINKKFSNKLVYRLATAGRGVTAGFINKAQCIMPPATRLIIDQTVIQVFSVEKPPINNQQKK